jgi:hypothetical protein
MQLPSLPNMGGIYVAQGAVTLPGTAAASNTVGTSNAITAQAAPPAQADSAMAAEDAPGSVGAPGFWEGLIPVWGSGRAAVNDFQNGRYVWGTVNAALAVTDVFLLKSAVSAVGKVALKVGEKILVKVVRDTAVKETAVVAEKVVVEEGAKAVAARSTAIVPRNPVGLGKWGEARLAQDLGFSGVKPSTAFKTRLGNRYVDRLVNGIAHEAKAGINVGLTPFIRTQVLKDADLIATGKVRGVVWHFYQGVKQELLDFLKDNGIQYVVHS